MENFKIGLLLKLVNDGDYDTEDSKSLLNKYEINEKNYLKTALKEDYIKICDIQQGTVKELKEILKNAGLVQTGNKETLIQRVSENVNEAELKKYFGNDKYKITPLGRKFLKDNIEDIEKVMRAVKSSNKKRGRNITIGAVVGMLLSCISVMGADIIGLDITQGANGEILFNNQKYDKATHSFSNNTFKNNVYTNNMEISGEKDSGEASGIKLSLSDTAISIVNNGKILGNNSASGNNSGNGIDNILGTIENLTNTGTITGSSSGIGTGIINASGIIRNLTNTGIILGSNSSSGYGIYNLGERIENLTNTGIILGSKSGSGIGISNYLGAIENLTNTGMILGSKSGSDNSYGISNVSGTIDNLTNTGMILGSESGSGYSYGIINGSLIENLTNIGMILGSNSDYGTGIYNDTGTIENLTNIGMILGNKSSSGNGYGIGNYSSERIENLTNTGMILGSESSSDNGYGIDNGSLIENLTNIGIITGNKSGYGAGINNVIGTIGNLTNTGKILGSKSDYGTGIYNDTGTIENLTNIGMILGNKSSSGNGYGIGNYSSELIGNLNNLGVIYGKTNAINNNSGTITNGVNYGLLISNNSSGNVVGGDLGIVDEKNKEINKIVNYGLAFNFDGGSYKTKDEYHNNFGTTSKVITIDGKNYTIINVGAVVGDPSGNIREITSWKSLGMKNGELFSDANTTTGSGDITTSSSSKGYILNGIEDTLKVIEKDEKNILNNSIINAYKTAVNIGADSNLTLGNTVINGGADGTSPVIFMAGENSILSIDKNSKINGDISSAGANNEITIKESIINGDITTSENGNTLNLIGNRDEKRVVLYNNTMNIFHNIDGFAKINIGNNVAFYEDSKITDVENVNIQKDGILVLRIDSTDLENGTNKIIGHALYGATSSPTTPISLSNTTISSDGGKLLLTLNGAGNTDIISFGTTKLDGSIKGTEAGLNYQEDFTIDTTSFFHSAEKIGDSEIRIVAQSNLPMFREIYEYDRLNGIYKGIISVDELRNFAVNTPENLSAFLEHLNDIYAGNPYSYSSELSRKSAGMFRDIVVDNNFKPNLNNWLIYGGLTHTDGGNRDTYYGENYYLYDTGSSNIDADTKITGAYMLGEYGVFDSLTAGIIIGGNKLKSNISNGSKVDGSALYLGAYAKKYLGNLKVTGGLGFQYGDYDADRLGVNKVASDSEKSVIKYSDNYNDMTYDIYLNGRYSHQLGDNLFLEPYATLSYTYIKQDGADEGNKTLAIETDSKSFDYTVGKIGVDLKKNISHSNGKSTLSAGVNYTKILDGAEQEFIKGRFKGGSDFDILVAHKNQHSIGLNAKYALELENGLLFDIKGTYSVERDSHNGSGKNKTKGEWIVGTGLGYKF